MIGNQTEAARAAIEINIKARESEDLLSDGHLESIIQRLLDERDLEIERLKNRLELSEEKFNDAVALYDELRDGLLNHQDTWALGFVNSIFDGTDIHDESKRLKGLNDDQQRN